MILVFISKFENKKIIDNVILQIKFLKKISSLKINVLYESTLDYQHALKKNLKKDIVMYNIKSIINLKKKFINNEINYLESFILSLNTKFLIINLNTGSFRSLYLKDLQNIANRKNINIIFPFNTLFRGRVSIYNSIFLQSDELSKIYNNKSFENDSNYLNIANQYIKNYIEFETNQEIRLERFKKNKITFSEKYFNFILSFNFKTRIKNKYCLLLLPKFNNWYNSYANPENNNFKKLIDYVSKIIPKEYKLVLKIHPKQKLPINYILYLILRRKKILVYFENSSSISNFNLVQNAEVVFTAGTTAIVLPLLLMKKIIEIGDISYYLWVHNSPFKKINLSENFNKNRILINNVINNNNIKKIIFTKYIYSVLFSSFSIISENETYNIDYKKNKESYFITIKHITNYINKLI